MKKPLLRIECGTCKIKKIPTKSPPQLKQKLHAERAKRYALREPLAKQCCLRGKIEEEEEKINRFKYLAQGTVNTHPHLNHRIGMEK